MHPNNYIHNTRILNELLADGKPSSINAYYSWNFDDNESDEEEIRASLGLGDFATFDFMLLMILPSFSSLTTQLYITIGHIIAIQIGQLLTSKLHWIYNSSVKPGLPLPVIVFSLYFLFCFCME